MLTPFAGKVKLRHFYKGVPYKMPQRGKPPLSRALRGQWGCPQFAANRSRQLGEVCARIPLYLLVIIDHVVQLFVAARKGGHTRPRHLDDAVRFDDLDDRIQLARLARDL